MATLTEFILARVAEDEAAAKDAAVAGASWHCARNYGALEIESSDGTNITCDREGLSDSVQDFAAGHIARHDPARVLAECEAKRRIVEAVEADARIAAKDIGRHVLRLLAAIYADHPNYDEERKP